MPLSNWDIEKYAKQLDLPLRGVYMRDSLPATGPKKNEMGVMNLDDRLGLGTHWVCYSKKGKRVDYFDSFGNLPPPKEMVKYMGKDTCIYYNYGNYQSSNSVVCGHLCLLFLASQS